MVGLGVDIDYRTDAQKTVLFFCDDLSDLCFVFEGTGRDPLPIGYSPIYEW